MWRKYLLIECLLSLKYQAMFNSSHQAQLQEIRISTMKKIFSVIWCHYQICKKLLKSQNGWLLNSTHKIIDRQSTAKTKTYILIRDDQLNPRKTQTGEFHFFSLKEGQLTSKDCKTCSPQGNTQVQFYIRISWSFRIKMDENPLEFKNSCFLGKFLCHSQSIWKRRSMKLNLKL